MPMVFVNLGPAPFEHNSQGGSDNLSKAGWSWGCSSQINSTESSLAAPSSVWSSPFVAAG